VTDRERMGVISKAILSLNKGNMQILSEESIHIHRGNMLGAVIFDSMLNLSKTFLSVPV
jgi:hypothetical protein